MPFLGSKFKHLPEELTAAFQALAEKTPSSALKSAAGRMTDRYRATRTRDSSSDMRLATEEKRAYLQVRMPATYAVLARCFNEIKKLTPDFLPHSFLDVGAGPGTASWAAATAYPGLQDFTLVEKDQEWIHHGKDLASHAEGPLKKALWQQKDMVPAQTFPLADMVTVSYSLNELTQNTIEETVKKLWHAVRGGLLIVEPGSRHGFDVIRTARQILIGEGAFILAPCPHQHPCPMQDPNWCHFQQMVQRSQSHRQIKGGSLPYETEKFSYIFAMRDSPISSKSSRVVAAPLQRSGHVRLDLCTPEGALHRETVSRRQGDLYRTARKVSWGDTWPMTAADRPETE